MGRFALVDRVWLEELSKYKWHFDTDGYATTTKHSPECNGTCIKGICRKIFMHRIIAGTPREMVTDHINRDKLDNRGLNLRICTRQENYFNRKLDIRNKSGYRGVCFDKVNKKWKAYIQTGKRWVNLGRYDNKIDAARAFNEAAVKLMGNFVNLNRI